jgi:SAM-dependent methyltransferase
MTPDVLPFADASFDSVLLDNVLEHIEAPTLLLGEVRRVLVPGGRFLVGVPGQRGWESDPDHKVMYDEASSVRRWQVPDSSRSRPFTHPSESPAC